MQRAILLADMNTFFASVHQALNPALKGKPVIVGGDPARRHGIVLTASYEAKAKGVKTGMTVYEAQKLCPEGAFIRPHHHLYIHFSTRILRIMRDFTPLVEPFSIDEAFLDVTGCRKLFGSPVDIALALKRRIREAGVMCSVGIGSNKLLAKMAAGLQKPDGLTILDYKDVPMRIWPLPVRELFGVGPRYEHHLKLFNIHTIGDLARFPVKILKKRFGVNGEILLFVCALGTGLRRGELLGLKWQDVNFDKATITVRRTLARTKEGLVLQEPKSQASRRTVTLPEEVVKALKAVKIEQAKQKLKTGPLYQDNDLVFASNVGTFVNPENIMKRHLHPVLKKVGLPRIRFHDLRHTHATLLLLKGENIKVVSERLGHTSVSFTLKTYGHVLPGMQEGAAKRINAVLETGSWTQRT